MTTNIDQLLSKIDQILASPSATHSSLHLRVMDLLDNPTQRATEFHSNDLDLIHVITDADEREMDLRDEEAPVIFSSAYLANKMTHIQCVTCQNNLTSSSTALFCSTTCASAKPVLQESIPTYLKDFARIFYTNNPDIPKPLHQSNLCVNPMFGCK